MAKKRKEYKEPTGDQAIANFIREERQRIRQRMRKEESERRVWEFMTLAKAIAAVLDLEIIDRVTLRDIRTGMEYK